MAMEENKAKQLDKDKQRILYDYTLFGIVEMIPC